MFGIERSPVCRESG